MVDFRAEPRTFSTVGVVYWVTGLPGVGKKTLVGQIATRLRRLGRPVIELDEDRLLGVLGIGARPQKSDYRRVASIYSRLCRDVANNGHDVLISTVSMFHDVQHWNRSEITNYCEIYLKSSVNVISARHPKGLIAAGLAGRIRDVPGVDLEIEEPEEPDIRVDVDVGKSADAVANEVFRSLEWLNPFVGPSPYVAARMQE